MMLDLLNTSEMDRFKVIKEREALDERRSALDEVIKADMEAETDTMRFNILSQISKLPDYSLDDFEAKLFVYNDGKFRSSAEINAYINDIARKEELERFEREMKKNREYYQSGQYASDCEKGKIACWIPFLLNVGTLIIGLCSPYTFFYVIIFAILLLPVSLTITLICISKQAKYCENLAEEHKVPSYDPTYQKAIATGKAARLGLIASAVGTYHSISREMKSISNLEH